MTDIEIAKNVKLKNITEIAKNIGIKEDEIEVYGKYKAKISNEVSKRLKEKESLSFDGKFYLKEGDNIPFCPTCWESDKKAIHLIFKHYQSFGKCQECEVCKTKYSIGE